MIKTDIQVRFSDIDMLGHINNTMQQQYYDVGKIEYCQEILGFPPVIADESLIVVNVNSNYYEEIKVGSKIYVTTRISKLGTKSVTFSQEIVEYETQKVKGSCESVLVGFDLERRVGVEISEECRAKIIAHESDLIIK